MNNLNTGGIPVTTELIDAGDIAVGDRIIRNQHIAKVVRVKTYEHLNDDTIELSIFTEARGYETIMLLSRHMILRVVGA